MTQTRRPNLGWPLVLQARGAVSRSELECVRLKSHPLGTAGRLPQASCRRTGWRPFGRAASSGEVAGHRGGRSF